MFSTWNATDVWPCEFGSRRCHSFMKQRQFWTSKTSELVIQDDSNVALLGSVYKNISRFRKKLQQWHDEEFGELFLTWRDKAADSTNGEKTLKKKPYCCSKTKTENNFSAWQTSASLNSTKEAENLDQMSLIAYLSMWMKTALQQESLQDRHPVIP